MLERVTEDYFSPLPTRRSKHHNSTMSSYGLFACCEIPKIKDLEKWIASTNDILFFLYSLPPVICSFSYTFPSSCDVRMYYGRNPQGIYVYRVGVTYRCLAKSKEMLEQRTCQHAAISNSRGTASGVFHRTRCLVPLDWSYEQTGCSNWLNSISSIHLTPNN